MTKQQISPIIEAKELVELNKISKLIIVDASFEAIAQQRYLQSHLAGALRVDMNKDLADIKSDFANGGRHPLPTPVQFSKTLTNLGICPNCHIIIYDYSDALNVAARFWWMLKSAGISKVQVINGGYKAAINSGFPVSSGIEIPQIIEPYNFTNWLLPLADMEEVEMVRQNADYLVLDVRSKERFDGILETLDLVAGHIPGAVNVPLVSNLDNHGFFLSPEILKEKYLKVIDNRKPENVIVHCGSGVTACHTLLAMAYAGIEIPKLYVGSWSEWSRNNKPMAKFIS